MHHVGGRVEVELPVDDNEVTARQALGGLTSIGTARWCSRPRPRAGRAISVVDGRTTHAAIATR